MGNTIVVYQPGYFQPLHYYARVWGSDVFVLLNSAQLNRRAGQARARLKGRRTEVMITVPVRGGNRVLIKDAIPDYEQGWVDKHLKTIEQVYGKAPCFDSVFSWVERLLKEAEDGNWSLGMIGQTQAQEILYRLGWKGTLVEESEPSRFEDASDWMLEIVKKVGGDTYVCGRVAYEEYVNVEKFAQQGVEVVVQEWECPVYKQLGRREDFVPNCSILDGLMSCGSDELIRVLEGR